MAKKKAAAPPPKPYPCNPTLLGSLPPLASISGSKNKAYTKFVSSLIQKTGGPVPANYALDEALKATSPFRDLLYVKKADVPDVVREWQMTKFKAALRRSHQRFHGDPNPTRRFPVWTSVIPEDGGEGIIAPFKWAVTKPFFHDQLEDRAEAARLGCVKRQQTIKDLLDLLNLLCP